MNKAEAQEYWMPARQAFPEITRNDSENVDDNVHYRRSKAIANLLGIRYSEPGYYQEIELTEDQKHVLKLLAGPGGFVIRKILEARKRD